MRNKLRLMFETFLLDIAACIHYGVDVVADKVYPVAEELFIDVFENPMVVMFLVFLVLFVLVVTR